jgi:dihydroorotate dehydrogenase
MISIMTFDEHTNIEKDALQKLLHHIKSQPSKPLSVKLADFANSMDQLILKAIS